MTTKLDTLKSMAMLIADLIAAEEGAGAAPSPQAPPGHVYLPVTGHILPLPVEGDASLWGYLIRVGPQAGLVGSPSMRLASLASALAGETPTTPQRRDKWPEAVDRVSNWEAYATPEEIAKRRAEQEAAAGAPWVSSPRPRPTPTPPAVGSE